MIKTFVYINRKTPYGTIYAQESLDVVLIAAAFDQRVTLVYLDDGVFQLLQHQAPSNIGMKNFSKALAALGDYGVSEILVDQESLQQRGLSGDDLLPLSYTDDNDDNEQALIKIVSRSQLARVIDSADVLLNF